MGIPGMIKLVTNEPNICFCVPLTREGHRKISKLVIPYMCLGSTAPVCEFKKSLVMKIWFQADTNSTGMSYATWRLPSIPKNRVRER